MKLKQVIDCFRMEMITMLKCKVKKREEEVQTSTVHFMLMWDEENETRSFNVSNAGNEEATKAQLRGKRKLKWAFKKKKTDITFSCRVKNKYTSFLHWHLNLPVDGFWLMANPDMTRLRKCQDSRAAFDADKSRSGKWTVKVRGLKCNVWKECMQVALLLSLHRSHNNLTKRTERRVVSLSCRISGVCVFCCSTSKFQHQTLGKWFYGHHSLFVFFLFSVIFFSKLNKQLHLNSFAQWALNKTQFVKRIWK